MKKLITTILDFCIPLRVTARSLTAQRAALLEQVAIAQTNEWLAKNALDRARSELAFVKAERAQLLSTNHANAAQHCADRVNALLAQHPGSLKASPSHHHNSPPPK